MLLETATPTHMSDPISEGTLNVVCVMNNIHRIPDTAPGSAMMMTNGSTQDWKLTTINR